MCSFAATVGAFGMTLSSTNRLKRKSGDGLKTGLVFCGVIPTSGTIRRSWNCQTVIGRREIPENANPKTAPILEAVGKAESPEDAERFYSHTLVQLDLLDAGSPPATVPWFSRNRFNTGGQTTQVELNAVEPALPLSHHSTGASIDDFDDELKRAVNRKLRDEGSSPNEVEFRVPVAPIVWEAAFKSKQFLA